MSIEQNDLFTVLRKRICISGNRALGRCRADGELCCGDARGPRGMYTGCGPVLQFGNSQHRSHRRLHEGQKSQP